MDDDYLGKTTGSEVGTLEFEDKDFVIVLLSVGGGRTADIFLYYSKGNCFRENDKTGKDALDGMEAFPTNTTFLLIINLKQKDGKKRIK